MQGGLEDGMQSRRIVLLGMASALAGCQTAKPHGLSPDEIRQLNIVALEVGIAPNAKLDLSRQALAWARGRLPPPEGGMTYDPANPGASDPRMIEWGEKLKALAASPEALAGASADLAQLVKQQAQPVLLGQPGGPRQVRLRLTILQYDRLGSRHELRFDATLVDARTNAAVLTNNELVGAYTEPQGIYSGSIAGMIAAAVIAGAISAAVGDPIAAAARDGAQSYKIWLLKA
jgi:hypothetical protein